MKQRCLSSKGTMKDFGVCQAVRDFVTFLNRMSFLLESASAVLFLSFGETCFVLCCGASLPELN